MRVIYQVRRRSPILRFFKGEYRKVVCEDSALGATSVRVCGSGNPHAVICPNSVRGLGPSFIEENKPDNVVYDPEFDCGVTDCEYYRRSS